jgi:nucleoside-diphosphate-sugar epimerase
LNLFKTLNNEGYKISVTVLSRNHEKFLLNNPSYAAVDWLKWEKGNVLDYAIPAREFDLFIHGASDTTPEAMTKPSHVFQTIVWGTKHVLEHAISCNCKRLLIISSGAVYGEVSPDIDFIGEDVNSAPETNKTGNAYGEAKRASEMLAACFAKENSLEIVIARCFAFAGAGLGKHLVLNQLIEQAIGANEIIIKGSGLARRSFLHGQDLAIWLLKLLGDGNSNEVYNVGSDKEYTVKALAELIKETINPTKEIVVLGSLQQESRINYIPSIIKAKELGLDVWTTLEEAIREMAGLYLEKLYDT